jgi:integrase
MHDAHTKMRRGHVVPLTDWTVSELQSLKELSRGSRFVGPNQKGDAPANPQLITRSVTRLRERYKSLGIDPFTVHDLRRTGRTGLARLRVPKHLGQRVLNHSKEVIEGTYDVYEYCNEKRTALRKWERHLRALQNSPRPEIVKQAVAQIIAKRRAPKNRRKELVPIGPN